MDANALMLNECRLFSMWAVKDDQSAFLKFVYVRLEARSLWQVDKDIMIGR